MKSSRKCSTAIYVSLFVFMADFISKYLTNEYIPLMNHRNPWYPYGGIGVFKNFLGIEFSISHATNRGAAWGIFSQYQDYLLALRIILVIGIIIYLIFYNKNKSWEIPLALIIAGAAGNIVDAFIYGHVVDMFHFVLWGYDFPVFNIADISIFLGVSTLLLLSSCNTKVKARSVS